MTTPTTPAEVAAAVLDGISGTQGEAFSMTYWFAPEGQYGGVGRLAPDETPTCGTTLCAAGWAAHVTGWTLVHAGEDVPLGGGFTCPVYAEKNGVRRYIDIVAQEALGLSDSETFWYVSAERALFRLREIAES
jgi:hypothetical protein